MSIHRMRSLVDAKLVKGSGSILSNLDKEQRKAFAKSANEAIEHKVQHEHDVEYQEQVKQVKKSVAKAKRETKKNVHQPKSLSYWLLSASWAEIWHHLFSHRN